MLNNRYVPSSRTITGILVSCLVVAVVLTSTTQLVFQKSAPVPTQARSDVFTAKQYHSITSMYSVKTEMPMSSLIPADPIIAYSNNEFLEIVDAYALTGSGTSTDPFLITHYLLNQSVPYQVDLRNIDLHISISNNVIENGLTGGIRIDFSNNIRIRSNILMNHTGDGIFLNGTSGIEVSHNIINSTQSTPRFIYPFEEYTFTNFPFAIDVVNSSKIIIESNYLHDNVDGIWLWLAVIDSVIRNNVIENHELDGIGFGGVKSSGNVVEGNHITDTRYGVYVFNDQGNSLIRNNTISDVDIGIFNERSSDLTIEKNNIDRSLTGISSQGTSDQPADNVSILYNLVNNSVSKTLQIVEAKDNMILGNSFIYPETQNFALTDIGSNENTYEYNHYSTWIEPDEDGDGIVDAAFVIDEENSDPYPRVSAELVGEADYRRLIGPASENDDIDTSTLWIGVPFMLIVASRLHTQDRFKHSHQIKKTI